MAFDHGCMGRACEAVMRRISEAAALADAVLEMEALREAEPEAASEKAIRGLWRELSEAGFPVCADVLWRPAPGGDVWLGVGGSGGSAEDLREFVEARSAWRVV